MVCLHPSRGSFSVQCVVLSIECVPTKYSLLRNKKKMDVNISTSFSSVLVSVNNLDPDQARHFVLSGLIWVQTVHKVYQQVTLVGKGLTLN